MRTTLLSLVLFGAACATEVVSLDGDCDDCAADTDSDTDTDADADADEWSDYIWADGDDVYFSDDGFSDDVYLSPAYMVGDGGDLDWNLDNNYKVSNVSGAFAYNTSGWSQDCYEATLVSSLQTNDDENYFQATSIYNTADWWDNHDFCESGSTTAESWCTFEGDEDYLVRFCVTSSGVVPSGDI